ncbi:MAG: NAD(P)/FAD-dependent oxidoreductase [Halorhabdus sp.]
MADVTVIGGGVAGCTTAYLLADRGYDVTVVEKSGIGGLLREIEFENGRYCDSAPHILFFDDETERRVYDLFSGFADLESRTFYAKTYPTGDLEDPHDYPVSKRNIDRWGDAEHIEAELQRAPGKTDADFFDSFVRNQVGPTMYERYFRSYTAKHWGVSPTTITGDWFDFKIAFPTEERSFFGDDAAYYPTRRYTDILSDFVSDARVVKDTVTGLATDDGRVTGVETRQSGFLQSEYYVNTINPGILVDSPAVDLRYRSMVIVGARVRTRDDLFPEHVSWGYFPNDYLFTRVTEYGFTPQPIPEDELVLTFEFPTFADERLFGEDESWFRRYIDQFFHEQGIDGRIEELQVRRAPHAYPLPVEEEIETFETLNSQLSRLENLSNLGRVSTYEYIWIKDIVEQAYEEVEALAETTDH